MKPRIRVTSTVVTIALVCTAVVTIMVAAILQALHYNDQDLLKMSAIGLVMALAAPIAVLRLWWIESHQQFDRPRKEPQDASTA